MKSSTWRLLAAATALALTAGAARAEIALAEPKQKLTAQQQAEYDRLKAIARNIHPIQGDVKLPGAEATLRLGQAYYYVKPDEARTIIVDAWGNPPDNGKDQLGLIFPKDGDFMNSWGAIITYEDTGYVEDKDAESADYDKLVEEVHKAEEADNAKRRKGGYAPIHLVGWAQPPSYDRVHHSEIWARDLQFGGQDVDTLNYDIRLLGRKGVLSLNMVSEMPELANIRVAAKDLADHAAYDPGSRYEDYKPGSDAKAAFTVGGLVAAGLGLAVAKKVGLIGLILVFAKKGIVLILAAAGAVAAWFRRTFGKLGGKKPGEGGTVE